MAIAFRASSTPKSVAIGTINGNMTITLPSGIANNDLILVKVAYNNTLVVNSIPTGYTQIGTTQTVSTLSLIVCYRVSNGSDSGTTVSFPCTNSVTQPAYAITADVYSGCNPSAPIDTSNLKVETVVGTSHTTGSVTTTSANCWIAESVADKGAPASQSWTVPSGMTSRGTAKSATTAYPSMVTADSNAPDISPGTYGADTYTGTLSTSTALMSTIALAPTPVGSASASATGSVSLSGSGIATTIAAASATASLSLTGSGAGTVPTAPTVTYLDPGGPAPDGFIVVAKCSDAAQKSLALSNSAAMTSTTLYGPVSPDSDGFLRWTITGLASFTKYYLQVSDATSGLIGPVGNCWTAPANGTPASFNVTLGSCVVTNATDGIALTSAMNQAAHLTLFVGDQSYAASTSTNRTDHEAQVLNQINNVPGYAPYWRNGAKILTLSDHDAGPDNGPSDLADAPYMRASIDAYLHYSSFRALADTRNPVVGRYYTLKYGRVKFIVIDVRNTDRTDVTVSGTSTDTLLGATQKAWLKQELITSEPFKVIVADTQWMGAPDNTGGLPVKGDWWPAYEAERTEMINYISANASAVGHLEYWHGDAHCVAYATASKNTWGGFPVLCGSPFSNVGGGRNLSTFSAYYNNSGGDCRQYGYIQFTDTGTSITRSFLGIDASTGSNVTQVNNSVTVTTNAATSATASLSLSGTAATIAPVSSVTASLTFGGSTGAAARVSAASGSLSLAGTALGSASPGVSSGISFQGVASGSARVALAGSIVFAGTGTPFASASPTGNMSLGAATIATLPASGTGSISLSGSPVSVSNPASGILVLSSAAGGRASILAASGGFTILGSALGRSFVGALAGTLTFSGSAVAPASVSCIGTLTVAGLAHGTGYAGHHRWVRYNGQLTRVIRQVNVGGQPILATYRIHP
jgi:hypothetical protein